MRLDARDECDKQRILIQRLDARYKLLFTLAFVIAVVATPIGHSPVLGGLGLLAAFLTGISGISVRLLWRRWAQFALVVGFLAVLVAQDFRRGPVMDFLPVILTILVKNSLAFAMMLVLASMASWLELLRAMHSLAFLGCW